MQDNHITKLNQGDKNCKFVGEDGKACLGKWRKRSLKAGDTEGYCKKCNKKLLIQQLGLKRDDKSNL